MVTVGIIIFSTLPGFKYGTVSTSTKMNRYYFFFSVIYFIILHDGGFGFAQDIGQLTYGPGTKMSGCGMVKELDDNIENLEVTLETLKTECSEEFYRFSQSILENSDVRHQGGKCVLKSYSDSVRRKRYLIDLTSKIRENCALYTTTVAPCAGTQYAGRCYTLSSISRNWTDARDDCKSRGGHLVDITSEAENNIMKQLALRSTSDAVWLGATDELQEGVYRWVSNNQTMTFKDWYNNDPDGGTGQNCLSTYTASREWIDNDCPLKLLYICET